ncbi:hypothetical protein F4678DRAFT_459019 [Xylaria arbuscula]|nr:hypothetical protein F4678DRAFT_459019 [Xylaria arbuscula]
MATSGATTIIILSTVLNVAVASAAGLRFLARHIQQIYLGVDDYTILPGAASIGAATIIGAIAVAGEFGAEGLALEDRRTVFKKAYYLQLLQVDPQYNPSRFPELIDSLDAVCYSNTLSFNTSLHQVLSGLALSPNIPYTSIHTFHHSLAHP